MVETIGVNIVEPFIRADQYHFIRKQVQKLVNAHATANDKDVQNTVKSLVEESVLKIFPSISNEQEQLLLPITSVDDKEKAESFLHRLHPYVQSFPYSEQGIKKLFPKEKKLKVPSIDEINLKEISYLSWVDPNTNKKFIVARKDHKWIGLHGSFTPSNQKGICALCKSHEEVGMFLSKEKGKVQGTFIKRGNYICKDSERCNQNVTSIDKIYEFMERLKG